MNARGSDLFEPRVADWLEDDPDRAPDEVLTTVLAALHSIPQRRAAPAFRPAFLTLGWRLAAAVLLVLVVGIAGAIALRGPTVGPSQVPSDPGLTHRVDVPLHFYGINLAAEWRPLLSQGTATADTYSGPGSDMTVALVLIPSGLGPDEWADTYISEQADRAGSDCANLDPSAFEQARVGSSDGRLYLMPCFPGWLALTTVGDRAYDIRFTLHRTRPSDADEARLRQLLAGMTFDVSPTPALALSTFVSSRWGYSIEYPTGWNVTEAPADLGAFDTPWANGNQVDLVEGPGAGLPRGQPSNGTLDLAAVTLPEGTSLDDFTTRTAVATCGRGDRSEPIAVDGEAGILNEYDSCFGAFHQWVTVVRQGRGYHIVWLNDPGTAAFDRVVFQRLLATYRFPIDGSGWTPFTSDRHGISLEVPVGWGVQRATAPWIWQPSDPGPSEAATDKAIGPANEGFVVASQKLPNGMSADDWWADYLSIETTGMPPGCFPATRDEYQSTIVDATPGLLHGGVVGCNFTEVIVLVGGRAYQLTAYVNVDVPTGGVFDRQQFDYWLSTVHFDPASADDTP